MTLTILDPRSGQKVTLSVPEPLSLHQERKTSALTCPSPLPEKRL